MASRVLPPLLDPYLELPDEAALVVLTGILGASTNWLVLRHMHSYLKPNASARRHYSGGDGSRAGAGAEAETFAGGRASIGDGTSDEVSVMLVSFLREFSFWKEGAGRLGLDLEALGRKGRFEFVDGLSGLFTSVPGYGSADRPPERGTQVPARGGASVRPRSWAPTRWTLTSPAIADVGRVLHAAVDELQACSGGGGKVVLVVDQIDLLLAAASEGKDGTSGLALRELLFDLREVRGCWTGFLRLVIRGDITDSVGLQKTHATVLTLSADEPLIGAQTTALEKAHASFVLSLAHEAQTVASLRLLDTGAAKDVSGVVRITDGGNDSGTWAEEREYLYFVGGDGSVRVFERGQ